EDSDGDGKHDHRTVFAEGLNYVTGIEVGFGGAWVMSPPNMYFIPDQDGDDRPDGEPEILLDGFGNHANSHNLANGFAWGPDGWLYGTHGRTNWSMLGKPGTGDEDRRRFDGGVYRYHPTRHVWEPYADGTTNPWGIDWNDHGHAFVCNCVNPHLFQVIQGAHYEPWRGRINSQYAYQRIDTIADHLHFTGLSNIRHAIGTAAEDEAGGGHAHCGTMIYLGDNFPPEYRNTLFTNNIHGKRINNDLPARHGSGYVASHGKDLLRSTDPWFVGVTLAYGPAGEVFVSDWSDTGECHYTKNTRRETGRIYRVTYGNPTTTSVDLAKHTDQQLVSLQLHPNDWHVRHARRLLAERASTGQDMTRVHEQLKRIFVQHNDVTRKLRALWTLHVTGGMDESFLRDALAHEDENIRSWAVTLLCETGEPSAQTLAQFVHLASEGTSPLVRLSLSSALQRLSPAQRWPVLEMLATRAEDVHDPNLPLMIWYGMEPLVAQDLERFVNLAVTSQIPRLRINAARRIAESETAERGLESLTERLAELENASVASDLLEGILIGVEGKRELKMPRTWRSAHAKHSHSENDRLKEQVTRLAVIFKDKVALEQLRQLAGDDKRDADDRTRAIETLVDQRIEGFENELLALLDDAPVRTAALRGLAAYQSANTAAEILRRYPSMNSTDQQTAQLTLASRSGWAQKLLEAVDRGEISPSDLTAYCVRQIRALGDESLNESVGEHWGGLKSTSQDKQKRIRSIKKWLSPDTIASADLDRGKLLFTKHCGTCHRFFGEGGKIGPDITGAQRTSLDYMLENIVAPNAIVAKDYQMELVMTADGRVITGLIESESAESITVQTVNERLVLPKDDVEARRKSDVSIMPEGLLDSLPEDAIRDLMGYLQRTQ
ncbi:MAG: PVC-type heme-binding CxxCH protein, partial [Planctomycetota bacterium]